MRLLEVTYVVVVVVRVIVGPLLAVSHADNIYLESINCHLRLLSATIEFCFCCSLPLSWGFARSEINGNEVAYL